jgi:hypothetical protein
MWLMNELFFFRLPNLKLTAILSRKDLEIPPDSPNSKGMDKCTAKQFIID